MRILATASRRRTNTGSSIASALSSRFSNSSTCLSHISGQQALSYIGFLHRCSYSASNVWPGLSGSLTKWILTFSTTTRRCTRKGQPQITRTMSIVCSTQKMPNSSSIQTIGTSRRIWRWKCSDSCSFRESKKLKTHFSRHREGKTKSEGGLIIFKISIQFYPSSPNLYSASLPLMYLLLSSKLPSALFIISF